MRKVSEVLAAARGHIAGGWAPTVSRAADGTLCGDDDEGIEAFSILDACLTAAQRDLPTTHASMRSLGLLVAPVLLGDWEADPKRTHGDVLQLFSRAHRHALTKETR